MSILIENNIVHLWRAKLSEFTEEKYFNLLSPDEAQRANRFRFPKHRRRFAITRGILREILSKYVAISPEQITFTYGQRGKPYLENNLLYFNISHSEEVAVYALTKEIEIGVDVQKIEEKYPDDVAKRFFTNDEYEALNRMPELNRAEAFCQLWAAKEAVIKAVGEGLYVPLGNFSIDLDKKSQWVLLTHEQHTGKYYVESFIPYKDYPAAFATHEIVTEKKYWEWTPDGPEIWDYQE